MYLKTEVPVRKPCWLDHYHFVPDVSKKSDKKTIEFKSKVEFSLNIVVQLLKTLKLTYKYNFD